MNEETYEEQTVFGAPEEQVERIEQLKKEGWIVIRKIGFHVPFGIDEIVPGTLMQRKKKN